MNRQPIDHYTIQLQMLIGAETCPPTVRCIATSTFDQTTAEAWISMEQTRSLLRYAYGGFKDSVDLWMQQLQDHHYVALAAKYNEKSTPDHCLFDSHELLSYAFIREELHPWKPCTL